MTAQPQPLCARTRVTSALPGVRAEGVEQAQKTETCWLWRTCEYPKITVYRQGKRRCVLVHRKLYETLVGPIPKGHDLHHTCGNPRCINPAHLVPLTPTDHALLHGRLRGGA